MIESDAVFSWDTSPDSVREQVIAYRLWLRSDDDSLSVDPESNVAYADYFSLIRRRGGWHRVNWYVQAFTAVDTIKSLPESYFWIQTPESAPIELTVPACFAISPYPNPFNGVVNLSFQAARPGYYALELIDPSGRKVARLFDGFAGAGERRIVWDSQGAPAGTYWVGLRDGNGLLQSKLVTLVK